MKIALLGAPGTGQTQLTQALQAHLPEHAFHDAPSLALAQSCDRILLMGLDLVGDEPLQSAPAAQIAAVRQADAQLRAQLTSAQLSYAVVYGLGPERLRAALRLIFPENASEHTTRGRWRGTCEKCADPDCEFQLFTTLHATGQTGQVH